jgi:hypothetical protein
VIDATVGISAFQAELSSVADVGILAYGNPNNFSDVNAHGLAFRRASAVLSGGGRSSGLFFPNGINAGPATI